MARLPGGAAFAYRIALGGVSGVKTVSFRWVARLEGYSVISVFLGEGLVLVGK